MKNRIECPNCKMDTAIKIIYGMPDSYIFKLYEEKKFFLGGCVISDNDPDYHCTNCHANIFKKDKSFDILEREHDEFCYDFIDRLENKKEE